MIASHYAEPLLLQIRMGGPLRGAPTTEAETIRNLSPGESFDMLDNSLGWAWGYAGGDRRVGYVPSDAIRAS